MFNTDHPRTVNSGLTAADPDRQEYQLGSASSSTFQTEGVFPPKVQPVSSNMHAQSVKENTHNSHVPPTHSINPAKSPTSGITSPIDPSKLAKHLHIIGYDPRKTAYLVKGFTEGFRLEHKAIIKTSEDPKNDPSIHQHLDIAQDKINLEVQSGRMKGPFDTPPFPNFHVSPIKLTEKSEKGTYRLLHNLSWPYDTTSINAQIPEESKTVQYSSVEKAIKLIMKFPKGSYTRKSDIQNAFKLIPIHPSDHHKLCIKFANRYYYDTTLPMGASSACQIFEEFATALQAIYDHYAESGGLSTHYLDDYFFVDRNKSNSLLNSTIFDYICADIGVPQSPTKKTSPSQETEFLGILLDSLQWKAYLPQDKLSQYLNHISLVSDHKSITQKDLQSVVGKLSFAATVVPARAFLRRLINRINTVNRPYHFIKINTEMRKDLNVWRSFLQHYNGVTFFRSISILPSDHLNVGSDASKSGYGAVYGHRWLQERYPASWQQLFVDKDIGITILELYPILVLIGVFGSQIRNSSVLFHSDNTGVVEVVNKQSSPSNIIMNIIRPLVLYLIKYNIQLRSQHVQGSKNVLCDIISRFQLTPQILAKYGMQPSPTPIPLHLKAENFTLV